MKQYGIYLSIEPVHNKMVAARFSSMPFCCEQVLLEDIQSEDDPFLLTAQFFQQVTAWRMEHPGSTILLSEESIDYAWSLYFCRYVYYKRTMDSFGEEVMHRIVSLCGPLDDRFVLEPMDDQMILFRYNEDTVRESLRRFPAEESVHRTIPKKSFWHWKASALLMHLYFLGKYTETVDEHYRPILLF